MPIFQLFLVVEQCITTGVDDNKLDSLRACLLPMLPASFEGSNTAIFEVEAISVDESVNCARRRKKHQQLDYDDDEKATPHDCDAHVNKSRKLIESASSSSASVTNPQFTWAMLLLKENRFYAALLRHLANLVLLYRASNQANDVELHLQFILQLALVYVTKSLSLPDIEDELTVKARKLLETI